MRWKIDRSAIRKVSDKKIQKMKGKKRRGYSCDHNFNGVPGGIMYCSKCPTYIFPKTRGGSIVHGYR